MSKGFVARVLAASLALWSAVAGATVISSIGLTPTAIITACDMSTVSCTSNPVAMFGIDNINIQCVWTGTPTGNFTTEVSLDAVTWTVLPTTFAAGGAAGNFDFDMNQMGSAYFHVIYTKTGSTGTANCTAYGKKV